MSDSDGTFIYTKATKMIALRCFIENDMPWVYIHDLIKLPNAITGTPLVNMIQHSAIDEYPDVAEGMPAVFRQRLRQKQVELVEASANKELNQGWGVPPRKLSNDGLYQDLATELQQLNNRWRHEYYEDQKGDPDHFIAFQDDAANYDEDGNEFIYKP